MLSCTSYHRYRIPSHTYHTFKCLLWSKYLIVFLVLVLVLVLVSSSLEILGLHDDTHNHEDEQFTEGKEYLWMILGMIAGIYSFFLIERIFSFLVPSHGHVRFCSPYQFDDTDMTQFQYQKTEILACLEEGAKIGVSFFY